MISLDLGQETIWFKLNKPYSVLQQSLCPLSKPSFLNSTLKYSQRQSWRHRANKTPSFYWPRFLTSLWVTMCIFALWRSPNVPFFQILVLWLGLHRFDNCDDERWGIDTRWFIVQYSLEVYLGCATRGDAFHHVSFAFTRFLRRQWLTPLMRHP